MMLVVVVLLFDVYFLYELSCDVSFCILMCM
jgi:hypothetical protein